MTQAKFKVGDRVKLVGNGITASATQNRGYEGMIIRVNHSPWINDIESTRKIGDYFYTLDKEDGVHEVKTD